MDRHGWYTAAQLAVGAAVAGGVLWLGWQFYGYRQARETYDALEQTYVQPAGSDAASAETAAVDFAALMADYPNAVAWIVCEDIGLSYPVMQADDNDYYLTHGPDGSALASGSIFLDSGCTLDDAHMLIYGHTMQNGTMFGSLKKYEDEDFYRSGTALITLYTPSAVRTYQIFAVQRVPSDSEVYTIGFSHNAVFAAFLQTLQAGAQYDTGVTVTEQDQVLTLSTCATMGGQQRLVISAKLTAEQTS